MDAGALETTLVDMSTASDPTINLEQVTGILLCCAHF